MEHRDGVVARWLLAAEQSERFAVEVLSGLARDAGACPEISDCLRQQQRNARRQIERLRLFRGEEMTPAAADGEQFSSEAGSPAADPGAGADRTRTMEVSYSLQKLQCALYQRLLAVAEAAGDADLASLCQEAMWIKDAMAARVKCGSAGCLENGSNAGQGAREQDSAGVRSSAALLSGRHGVEIRHGTRGLEVVIPISADDDPQLPMQSLLSQAWTQLADAISGLARDAEPSPVQSAVAKGTAANERQGRALPPGSGAGRLS